MKLIVGLGNPGNKYEKNLHNVGFVILDTHAKKNNLTWKYDKKFDAEIINMGDTILAKPQTFMNKSGESVSKIMSYFNIDPSKLLVIHDDVDFPSLEIHKQIGRSSAGHRGVQNIIDVLKTSNFERIRIGVGRPENTNIDTEDWVLMDFDKETLEKLISDFDYTLL